MSAGSHIVPACWHRCGLTYPWYSVNAAKRSVYLLGMRARRCLAGAVANCERDPSRAGRELDLAIMCLSRVSVPACWHRITRNEAREGLSRNYATAVREVYGEHVGRAPCRASAAYTLCQGSRPGPICAWLHIWADYRDTCQRVEAHVIHEYGSHEEMSYGCRTSLFTQC